MEKSELKKIDVQRNSARIVFLRKKNSEIERGLILLLKRFKDQKEIEKNYLKGVNSKRTNWVQTINDNEARNLLFVISKVRNFLLYYYILFYFN